MCVYKVSGIGAEGTYVYIVVPGPDVNGKPTRMLRAARCDIKSPSDCQTKYADLEARARDAQEKVLGGGALSIIVQEKTTITVGLCKGIDPELDRKCTCDLLTQAYPHCIIEQ